MKKQQKTRLRRLLGVLTALLVAAGIAVGVYWVGSLRGWFAQPPVTVETSSGETVQIPPLSLTAQRITGKALVERGGLSFALEQGEALRAEDAVTLQGKGTLTLGNETLTLTLGDKASFLVGQTDGGEAQITLNQGVLYAQSQGTTYFVVGNQSAQVTDGVISLSVGKKTLRFDQLSGSTSFFDGDKNVTISAGQRLTAQQTEKRWGAPAQQKLTLAMLSDFTLEQAKATTGLCFTTEELTGEIAAREAKAQQELEEKLRQETEQQEAEAQAKAQAEETEQAKAEQEKLAREAKQKAAEEKKAQEAKRKAEEEKKKQQEEERKRQEEEEKKQEQETTTSTGSCTLTIECHTLLDNLEDVKESKKQYVPASGVILKKTKVTFTEGETVYDILKRTCKQAGIQLEVSYSGGYGSYYVEGIGHLYEFDCGRESGWVYSVNGKQPNYGCSSCVVQEGDRIVWSYTCSGMGKDV